MGEFGNLNISSTDISSHSGLSSGISIAGGGDSGGNPSINIDFTKKTKLTSEEIVNQLVQNGYTREEAIVIASQNPTMYTIEAINQLYPPKNVKPKEEVITVEPNVSESATGIKFDFKGFKEKPPQEKAPVLLEEYTKNLNQYNENKPYNQYQKQKKNRYYNSQYNNSNYKYNNKNNKRQNLNYNYYNNGNKKYNQKNNKNYSNNYNKKYIFRPGDNFDLTNMKENIGMFGQNNGNPLNKKQTNINDTKNKQEIKADEIYRKGIYNNDNEKKELEIIDERNLQNLNPTQLYSQFNQPPIPKMINSEEQEEIKIEIADSIYEIVYSKYPEEAGKITGMIKETGLENMNMLLSKKEELYNVIEQAYEMINNNKEDLINNGNIFLIDNGFDLILYVKNTIEEKILFDLFEVNNINDIDLEKINEGNIFDYCENNNEIKNKIGEIIENIRNTKAYFQNLKIIFEGINDQKGKNINEILIEDNYNKEFPYSFDKFINKIIFE